MSWIVPGTNLPWMNYHHISSKSKSLECIEIFAKFSLCCMLSLLTNYSRKQSLQIILLGILQHFKSLLALDRSPKRQVGKSARLLIIFSESLFCLSVKFVFLIIPCYRNADRCCCMGAGSESVWGTMSMIEFCTGLVSEAGLTGLKEQWKAFSEDS